LRFNSADSAYLNRTPASASNQKTWTWSGWVKRSALSTATDAQLFSAGTASAARTLCVFSSNQIYFLNNTGSGFYGYYTSAVFRDFSAWYHIVFSVDTTQATASNRVKIYVNNVLQTLNVNVSDVPQNVDTYVNAVNAHAISKNPYNSDNYFDGYMTEVNFIDGQALTPSSFGETNAQTGVWQPKAYSGSYGTNGFYLNFSDNSNTTAATLGKDYSGNGNNWTPNNFSVTAGAGNDSMVDSPTQYGVDTGVGGSVRGNYCTVNAVTKTSTMTLTNGNLNVVANVGDWAQALGTLGMSSGKWYFEATRVGSGGGMLVGIAGSAIVYSTSVYMYQSPIGYLYYQTGQKYNNNVDSTYGASYTDGDVVGVAFDADAGTLVFYKNGASQGTAFSGLTNGPYLPAILTNNSGAGNSTVYNFGQRPFAYTAPSGFKALCTQNLPTPAIGATTATLATQYFNPVLYTGDRTSRTISVGFQPDWVWVKSRSAADDHYLMNAVVGTGKYLNSNSTAAETTNAASLTAYTSDGFSVGNTGTTNETGRTYVAWNWKASGSTVSNTSGSITSTVSANTTSGFSVVTYTGTGVAATIGHGLGVAPSMVIVKSRSNALHWVIYATAMGSPINYLLFNTDPKGSAATVWNNTAPTSTVFSIGTDSTPNTNGGTYVAYCFAPVAGFSALGSYTGNGSTDGPFVFTGMRPAYVMIKRTDSASDWYVWDTKRDTYNVVTNTLLPNSSGAETSATSIDDLSNGFKCRSATVVNASGGTYIYMAFAESPFKYSLAR
jgi:hypothetical protein